MWGCEGQNKSIHFIFLLHMKDVHSNSIISHIDYVILSLLEHTFIVLVMYFCFLRQWSQSYITATKAH